MALLPSGRYVAIQANSLSALMDEAAHAGGVITRLLRIERIEHLRHYLDVMYFRWRPGATLDQLAPGGQPVPENLQPYASGYTLATISAEFAVWSECDRAAFEDYLASPRVLAYQAQLLDAVANLKAQLAEEGDFETRMQALMWQTNCHPVRSGDTHDPSYALLVELDDPNAGS